ncbi:MAG: glycosyltransferase [Bacteroidales bacterium]
MNYLFVTVDGGGNLPQVLGLAKRLKKRGHMITVLTEPCMEELIKSLDFKFIAFRKFFTRKDRKEDLLKDYKATPFSNPIFENVVFGPAQIVVDETLTALKKSEADILVADILLPPALIAAEYLKIPRAIAFHMPEYFPGPNRPPGNMGLLPGKGSLIKLRDRLFSGLFNSVFNKYKAKLNAIRDSLDLKPLENVSDLIHSADLRLIQTLPEFDFPIQPAPKNVRYTGPILDSPDWAGSWESPWPKVDERPLVVVAFSSTFQDQKQAIQNSIDSMRGLNVRGLITLGMAMQNEDFDFPDNVEVVKTAPHHKVFEEANLVITHAGHGTIMRALNHGLPLICMPMGRDQNDNAAKVVFHGLGVKLSKKTGPVKLRKAINQVITNDSFRENTRKFQQLLSDNQYQEVALDALEGMRVVATTMRSA